jgi:uroporphyrinogen-III synthase
MRKLLLVRPEPGLSASVERARALGLDVLPCPLFRIEPIAWEVPDPTRHEGLLITSANAVRYGGAGLARLKALPVHAVGEASAEAAREAGFRVETIGSGDVVALLASLQPSLRLLHLAGEEHRDPRYPGIERAIVYRSAPIGEPGLPMVDGLVAAVHSPRAGARLAELVANRRRTVIAAISPAAADACGGGWERIGIAETPDDKSLLALAASLCHTTPPQ